MSPQRIVQERQHVPLAQAQRLYDRENAFHESAAGGAGAAKGVFAPQNSAAQHALGVIVGRLYSLGHHETPQSRLQGKQVGAEVRCLAVGAGAAALQNMVKFSGDGTQTKLQTLSRAAAAPECVPGLENALDDGQACFAHGFCRAAPIHAFLEIPFQMSPTHLAAQHRHDVVGIPAVTDEKAPDLLTQQSSQGGDATVGVNQKGGHAGRPWGIPASDNDVTFQVGSGGVSHTGYHSEAMAKTWYSHLTGSNYTIDPTNAGLVNGLNQVVQQFGNIQEESVSIP